MLGGSLLDIVWISFIGEEEDMVRLFAPYNSKLPDLLGLGRLQCPSFLPDVARSELMERATLESDGRDTIALFDLSSFSVGTLVELGMVSAISPHSFIVVYCPKEVIPFMVAKLATLVFTKLEALINFWSILGEKNFNFEEAYKEYFYGRENSKTSRS